MTRFGQGRIYKEIRLIRICKDCGIQYRPLRYSWQATMQRCYHCRKKWAKENSWWLTATLEEKKEYIRKNYDKLQKWNRTHPELRRKVALASYHRRKKKPQPKPRVSRAIWGSRRAYFRYYYKTHRQARHEYYLTKRIKTAIPPPSE